VMAWVFQALVLALTALLWWLARRDLTSKAADARAPAVEDWARLHVTVEQLMVELERRAVVAEQRIYEAEQRLRLVEQRLQASFVRAEIAHGSGAAPEEASPPALLSFAAAPAPAMNTDLPAQKSGNFTSAVPDVSPAVPLTAPLPPPEAAAPPPAAEIFPAVSAPVSAAQAAPVPPREEPLFTSTPEPPVVPDLPTMPLPPAPDLPTMQLPPAPRPVSPPPSHLAPEEARYLPVFALADAGETDAGEIARQTGLPRGEIELVLSLRARRTI